MYIISQTLHKSWSNNNQLSKENQANKRNFYPSMLFPTLSNVSNPSFIFPILIKCHKNEIQPATFTTKPKSHKIK